MRREKGVSLGKTRFARTLDEIHMSALLLYVTVTIHVSGGHVWVNHVPVPAPESLRYNKVYWHHLKTCHMLLAYSSGLPSVCQTFYERRAPTFMKCLQKGKFPFLNQLPLFFFSVVLIRRGTNYCCIRPPQVVNGVPYRFIVCVCKHYPRDYTRYSGPGRESWAETLIHLGRHKVAMKFAILHCQS